MSIDNPPADEAGTADSAPQTLSEQVEDIANLLEDPEPDLQETEGHDAADAGPEDPDDIIAEDADEDTPEEPDGPDEPEYKGGRFAADDAKVRLDDGTTITIAELKRNNLYQRDYTKKTTEHAEERKQFEAKRSEVDQQAQSLSQTLEYINWYAENYLPKAPPEPVDPRVDPHGWQIYQAEKQKFDEEQQLRAYFQQQTQALSQQKQREAAQQRDERVKGEVEQLRAKDPLFRDKTKALAWFNRAQELAGDYYGFSPQEIQGTLTDHRLVMALRDAFRYRQLKAKAPKVREEVAKKPVTTGGKRADPRAGVVREKQARSEQLRRDGRFESGVASLMDLDL